MTNVKLWNSPQYGRRVYCGDILVPTSRTIWPSLAKPKDAPDPKPGEAKGNPRYEVSFLLDKKNPKVIKFIEEIEALTKEGVALYNKDQSTTIGIGAVFGKDGDGDTYNAEKYPHHKGHWVLTARNKEKPKCIDTNMQDIDPNTIKGGMIGRAQITPHIGSYGLKFKLSSYQFIKDDNVRYGGVGNPTDLLSQLEEDTEGSESVPKAEVVASETLVLTPEVAVPEAPKKGIAAGVNLLV